MFDALVWYDWLVLGCYGLFLMFVFTYSLSQLHLLVCYWRGTSKSEIAMDASLPKVTVQLPVYNERYVIERLIDAVMSLDYPKALLEVQVLDDSDDETSELAKNSIQSWLVKGFDVKHVKRPDRSGFKAGALAYGLEYAQGDFIAIFDADFLPDSGFLKSVMPQFNDPKVGLVQTRWGHLNREYSLLTEMQAFGLDAHFSIEQSGRKRAQSFINFNGTAGVWRKEAILDAGGWSSDTLTEDLDLSYRAQMKGWEFLYLEGVVSPAELPITMSALKTQQFRWTKGAAECALKNLGKVWSSSDLSLQTKLHAHFHLLNSSIFIHVLILALLSIPLLMVRNKMDSKLIVDGFGVFFSLSLVVLFTFYYYSYKSLNQDYRIFEFIKRFIIFLSMSMGMSLHNSIAVLEGYFGVKTPFIRTPKFNLQSGKSNWRANVYLRNTSLLLLFAEIALSAIFAMAILLGVYLEDYGLMPLHLLLSTGFALVAYYGLKHTSR